MLENLRDHTKEEAQSLCTDEARDISRHARLAQEFARFSSLSRELARFGIGPAAWHMVEMEQLSGKVAARREMFGDFCEPNTMQ